MALYICIFIYLFGVLRRFQYCTGHITTGSWKGRGNQYIQLVKVLYCKVLTNGKQLPAFPLEALPGTKPRPTEKLLLNSNKFTLIFNHMTKFYNRKPSSTKISQRVRNMKFNIMYVIHHLGTPFKSKTN